MQFLTPLTDFYFNFMFKGFVLLQPLTHILSYPIVSVDGKPITFGKIIVGLLFLFGGIYVSKVVINLISRKILTRFIDSHYAIHSIENFSFYFFIFFFAIVSLEVANIPATALSLLGGAFIVAVGFGAKNVMNDFISGLIILIERPVKIGDIVFVDNMYGVIEDIGMRSTRINTYQNKHIIVPNNKLVENSVNNLTHSSKRVRSEIKVGVHYKSDVELVRKCLVTAARENPKTLKGREPLVIFNNFGDSSLEFILAYDIKIVRPIDERLSNSFVRENIMKKFKEKGVVIAYPQQDVHLFTGDAKILETYKKQV